MSVADAVAFVDPGDTVAISGFASAGTPKRVVPALAERIHRLRDDGTDFTIDLLTSASVSAETERLLAELDGTHRSRPLQGCRGHVDVAVIEVAGITESGELVPAASVGDNKTWLDVADKIILEVNSGVPEAMAGMHDIYYGAPLPPHRAPLEITRVDDRIGQTTFRVDPAKVVAVVETDSRDSASPLTPPDAVTAAIAGHVLEFFDFEVRAGRLPADTLLPLQAGFGNIANAVLSGLGSGPYRGLNCYCEVIQDGMLNLIKDGTVAQASSTALALTDAGIEELNANIDFYRRHITLRPHEISNHPEVVRRLGVIAMNEMLEADVYGNVNSTHVLGATITNELDDSGDFARNGHVSMFMSPSTARGGTISSIVPMIPHVDHTVHDKQVVVTEQGLADLRGLSPRERARLIVDKCAHPEFRPLLHEYIARAEALPNAGRAPHVLGEAFLFHQRYLDSGTMHLS